MAFGDTATLTALLKLDDKFSGPLKNAQRTLKGFDAKLDDTASRGFRAGQQIGTGIKNGLRIAAGALALLGTQVIVGLNQLVQLEKQTAQTNAGLISTKGASGQTATSIRAMSEAFENLNAVMDDKVIQSGANVLLTFTRIGKEAFEPALAAALDLSTAMGQDLQTSIVQIGKALNDPLNGFGALRRVGIQFTADQQKQIKTLQESGDLLGAQRVILQELGTEFGGRFAAQGRTAEGAVAGIGDAVEDLQKSIATALFPTIQRLLPRIRDTLGSPQFAATVAGIGESIAKLFSSDNIEEGGRILSGLFKTAQEAAPALQRAAEVTGQVIGTAVNLFKSLPPEIQALAVTGLAVNKLTGGLVTNIAGGLISAVISSFKGMMNVNAAVVNVNGAVGGGGPGVGDFARGAAGAGALSVGGAVAIVGGVAVGAAGLGLLIDQIHDPDDLKKLAGKAETARARGIPDANNKPLQELLKIRREIEQQNSDAKDRERGEAIGTALGRALPLFASTGSLPVSVTNPGAFIPPGGAEARGVINADRAARGLGNNLGPSTSLQPRFNFLRGAASGAKDVAVSNAIAQGFERGATPLFRNTKLIPKAIKELERDQRQLLKAGDTKNAALIGKDIDRLKAEVARRGAATARAIKAQKEEKAAFNIGITLGTYINGRLFDAQTTRYTSSFTPSLARSDRNR